MQHRIVGPHVAVAIALMTSAPAFAQDAATVANGYSIDIEFLRPTFGHNAFYGVDVPQGYKDLTVRAGTLLQYQQAPLTLYQAVTNEELGAVVANRFSAMVGASLDVSRLTVGVLIPTALNWGTDQQRFGADGFGVGDIGLTGRVVFLETDDNLFNAGARAGITLPTGKPDSYIGEEGVRFNLGLLAAAELGPVTLATDAGLLTRSAVETSEDFDARGEFSWANAVRVRLPDATRTAITGQVLARSGLRDFLKGGAENAVEMLGGLEFYLGEHSRSKSDKSGRAPATLGIGAGRGLTQGYGTTDFRLMGSLMVAIPPPVPPEPVSVVDVPPPPPPPPPIEILVDEPVEPNFDEDTVVDQVADRIYIRDKLKFHVDTNTLKDESVPTLRAIAAFLNEDAPLVAHLVIEGHASQEGDYAYNYTLAESRARRIWELLLAEGVAARRISYRGKGEVAPLNVGDDASGSNLTDDELAANRRVEFHVIRQYDGFEEVPPSCVDLPDVANCYPSSQPLPWNGEIVSVVIPALPEPEPEDTGPELDEFGMTIDQDEDDEFEIELDDDDAEDVTPAEDATPTEDAPVEE